MDKNVADIYVRLSDQDRDKKFDTDESESIQNQKTMLINYCLERNWQINGIYSDEDYSGADSKRPGWNAVLKDCENGKCSIVVCKTQSRFSRDMEMIEKYIHGKFLEWNVRFVGVVDNADTDVKGNKKARQINGLINEWYLEDLSDNIKSTLSVKRKNGEFVGSFAPYGYIVDPNNKNHLLVDRVAAETVRRIFNMYTQGFGYISIAKALNEDMVSPPCVRKKELGLKYYNGNFENSDTGKSLWTDSAVHQILNRMEYTGTLVQGRQEVINYKTKKRRKKPENKWDIVEKTHDPIISDETFLKVQEIRKKRGRAGKGGRGECHPLSRKVYCGVCNNTMWKMSYALKDGRYSYLSCRTRKSSNGVCVNKHTVRLDELEDLILREINHLLDLYYDKKLIGNIKLSRNKESEEVLSEQIENYKTIIAQNNERIKKMYTDKLDGYITSDEFISYRKNYEEKSAECLKKIKLLEKKAEETLKAEETVNSKKYSHIDSLTFEIADLFMEKVYIGNKEDNKPRVIKIEWKI